MNYLIVGNSAAAVGAIEAIRAVDTEGAITLLAAESEHTYSRPLISYRLAGKVDDAKMSYRPEDFYAKHDVDARLGEPVVSVDPKARTVKTASGAVYPYDRLLLATGGKPFVPPLKGVEGAKGVFTFTMWEDARQVDAYIKQAAAKDAVVLGGGMIGLKTAEALIMRGMKVTIVELADRLLANTFDHRASEMMVEHLKGRGAAVCLERTIEEVLTSNGAVRGVKLTGDLEIYCRILVVAIGVRPEFSYLEGSGIETGRGILVDDQMRTSAENVFAAGDVAEARDILTNQKRPIPILPLAYRQGAVAGRTMAGKPAEYTGGMPMNSIEICDLPTISVGLTTVSEDDGYEIITARDDEAGTYRKMILKNDRLVGCILVGDIDRAGIYTGLIEQKFDVSAVKHMLLSDEFGLLSLDPEYRKHKVRGPGIEV